MKHLLNIQNKHPKQFNFWNIQYPFILSLTISLLLIIFSAPLVAQTCCPNSYHVGSGSPSGISTLSAAKIVQPGIESPGDVCVLITGRFDIDAGETWNVGPVANALSQVYFADANSSLFVLNGGILNALSAVFLPCNFANGSWLGVYVQTGGTINTNNARFIDASNAGVSVNINSFFDIFNSKFVTCNNGLQIIGQQSPVNHRVDLNEFYNCTFDIYMLNASNVDILDNEYFNNEAVPSKTGIHMESFCQNINITKGAFTNRNRGISAIKTINLNISGAEFNSCQSAIYSMEGINKLWIKDCEFNETGRIGIHVNYHETLNDLATGIHIDNNKFFLHGAFNNMYLKDIGGSGKCLVSNNEVDLPDPGAIPDAYGIEAYKFYATGGLSIEHNQLEYDNAGIAGPGGIYVHTASQSVKIDANTVLNTGASGSMPSHIRALECRTTLDITGNTTDGGSSISVRGISIENCPAALTMCCNNLTNSHTGLYITGPLNNAQIYTTTFGAHPHIALHYDQVSSTGGSSQINHGNNWSGASGLWDAVFDGSPAVASITNYGVGGSNLPNGLTKIQVNNGAINPAIWFMPNGATEPTCATAGSCGGNNYPGGPGAGGEGRSEGLNAVKNFSTFPNPADQSFTVKFPASEAQTTLSLYDATGRMVMQQNQPPGVENAQLLTAQLPTGLYFLNLSQAGSIALRSKIMINH